MSKQKRNSQSPDFPLDWYRKAEDNQMATLLSMQEFESPIPQSQETGSGPERKPRSLKELDVRHAVVEELVIKVLYLSGSVSMLELSDMVKLSYEVTDDIFCRLRAQSLCQVTGMSGNIPHIGITAQGRTRAMELTQQSQYTGVAPVALQSYVTLTRKQSVQHVEVHAEHVNRAFRHLVIDPEMLRQFGTALNSGSAIFLYGAAGTGKTTVAEVLSRVLAEDSVWIPYAVEVDGQIITVYDPAVHRAIEMPKPSTHDERWVKCHRPAVLVGGELTAEMLDMQFNPGSKFYVGPVQMKANNGVLIIDDFGRQRLRPDELLNRWIVPLDRRIDFLTLAGGKKLEIPFEMLVVFASNNDPASLVDPAFMRRIQTKIKLGTITDEQFAEIFRRVAVDKSVTYEASIPEDLIGFIRNTLKEELRCCHPRDIVNQVCWQARYEQKVAHMDHQAMQRAVKVYFSMI
jgi:predicted ATPase with chaperone activity